MIVSDGLYIQESCDMALGNACSSMFDNYVSHITIQKANKSKNL